MKLNTYLGFDGKAQEAMTFYQSVFGGELNVMHVSDTPMCDSMPGDMHGLVMHSSLTTPQWTIMGTDMRPSGEPVGSASVATTWESESELKAAFDKMKDGGTVIEDVGPAFWGGSFGCLKDRYGVTWLFTTD